LERAIGGAHFGGPFFFLGEGEMKARIDIKEEDVVIRPEEVKKSPFGKKTVIPAETQRFLCLSLYVELSQEEKAIININHLDQIVLDVNVRDTTEEDERELANARNEIERQIREAAQNPKHTFERSITLADFVANPFEWRFYTVREANEYANKIKAKILPHLKEILTANYQVGPTSETFEF
jgi:hypothetical protein